MTLHDIARRTNSIVTLQARHWAWARFLGEARTYSTDQLRSYAAAHRTAMPSVVHRTRQYETNRAILSHHPPRQRERQMRRFKSAAPLHRVASVHGVV